MKAKKIASPPSLTIVDPSDVTMIIIGAFRYYLGRRTISVWAFGQWLENNWGHLGEGTRQIIQRELEEEFGRDAGTARLGDDCDRATWSRVRRLYRIPACCLCGKSMDGDTKGTIHSDGEYSCATCAPLECEICEKPFNHGEVIIPNPKSRRAKHPGCKAKEDA